MIRHAAFLRGVNLGKRSVKSADLKQAFEGMGMQQVKTLLASGNVLFDCAPDPTLKSRLEQGLEKVFGFRIGVVLRTQKDLADLIASDPFGRKEGEDAKLHVMLFDTPVPKVAVPQGIPGDVAIAGVADREIFLIYYRKPDGTYVGNSALDIEKALPKGVVVTTRNWNTILKAAA